MPRTARPAGQARLPATSEPAAELPTAISLSAADAPDAAAPKRPTRARLQTFFLREFARSGSLADAAARTGIAPRTVQRWRASNIVFAGRYEAVLETRVELLEDAAMRRALGRMSASWRASTGCASGVPRTRRVAPPTRTPSTISVCSTKPASAPDGLQRHDAARPSPERQRQSRKCRRSCDRHQHPKRPICQALQPVGGRFRDASRTCS